MPSNEPAKRKDFYREIDKKAYGFNRGMKLSISLNAA
jgi:hypothetical protein